MKRLNKTIAPHNMVIPNPTAPDFIGTEGVFCVGKNVGEIVTNNCGVLVWYWTISKVLVGSGVFVMGVRVGFWVYRAVNVALGVDVFVTNENGDVGVEVGVSVLV